MSSACSPFGALSLTRPAISGLLIVMCLLSKAAADGTIVTCTNLEGKSFTAPGGATKPGWAVTKTERSYQLKLAITNNNWDIIQTSNGSFQRSAASDGCSVGMYLSPTNALDMLVIVVCKDEIETMRFYTLEGQDRVIATTLSRELGATVTETADCHKGD